MYIVWYVYNNNNNYIHNVWVKYIQFIGLLVVCDSSVTIVIILCAGWPTKCVSIPDRGKRMLNAPKYRDWLWSSPNITLNGFRMVFLYIWPFKRRVKCLLLELLGAHNILHVSRIRFNAAMEWSWVLATVWLTVRGALPPHIVHSATDSTVPLSTSEGSWNHCSTVYVGSTVLLTLLLYCVRWKHSATDITALLCTLEAQCYWHHCSTVYVGSTVLLTSLLYCVRWKHSATESTAPLFTLEAQCY